MLLISKLRTGHAMSEVVARDKLPLLQLQAFEAVARLGSIQAARAELESVSVSKDLTALEESLGVTLISRKPRARLTREGKILSAYLSHVFDQTSVLLDRLREGKIDKDLLLAILKSWPR
jgi:DNA-binding transcriptional LysR family regulator